MIQVFPKLCQYFFPLTSRMIYYQDLIFYMYDFGDFENTKSFVMHESFFKGINQIIEDEIAIYNKIKDKLILPTNFFR